MNKNEIQPATIQLPADKQHQNIDIHISQTGEGKQYGYVNHYEDHRKVAVVLPQMDDDEEDNTPDGRIELDVSCYNLFVIADELFRGKYFVVPKNQAIAVPRCTPEDLISLSYLSDNCQTVVKSFPAIFASTNHGFARTDNSHMAFFGIIRRIQIKEDGIWIYFYKYRKLSQQILNEYADEFGIIGTEFKNELDDTHWSIKRKNVIEALNKHGCPITLI